MPRRHPKHKSGGGRFARLPLRVLRDSSVIGLSHATFRVLVLLTAQFKGDNNGALGLSKSQAANQHISNKTLYQALDALEEHKLIEKTYPASRVPPRPTMYALTWIPVDDTDWSLGTRVPTRIFRQELKG